MNLIEIRYIMISIVGLKNINKFGFWSNYGSFGAINYKVNKDVL